MGDVIRASEMTLSDRKKLTKRIMRRLKELIIDQENEKLRQQGADFEYVLVSKEQEENA